MEEYLDVVNDSDEVIDTRLYRDVYKYKLTHRIVHILVFNPSGQLLLQKRSSKKSFLPLHWCTSAGGHVQTGESYQQAAVREGEEGLCVLLSPQRFRKYKFHSESQEIDKFLGVFRCTYDGVFGSSDEVDEARFVDLEEIPKMLEAGEKFHPELLFILKTEFGIG